jgi:hypothetical protein
MKSDQINLPNKITPNYMVLIALGVFLLTFVSTKAQVRKQTSHLPPNAPVAHRGQTGYESLRE